MTDITRRSITSGAAWSLPAITVAAAAPSSAGSPPPPSIRRAFSVRRSSNVLTVQSNNDSTSYYQVLNVTSNTRLTNVRASVLVNVSGLQFTGSTGWSQVTEDKQTYVDNGITYYRYFATLTAPVPAPVNGTVTIPSFRWTSATSSALTRSVYVNGRGTIAIDGTDVIQIGAYRVV